VAAAAYAARAGARVRVFAPDTTPRTILSQIEAFGGELVLLRGHIGDCGKASRAWAAESGAFDLSTLREPYRIEGKKTLGLELALQLAWKMPDVILYPTGGGTGLIGMWKAFLELKEHGWVEGDLPRFYSVQSTGCAPIVRAFEAGADRAEVWSDPWTVASGLRVPGPLGDRLMLRALRETNGGAVASRTLWQGPPHGVAEEVDVSRGAELPGGARKLVVAIGGSWRQSSYSTPGRWLYRSGICEQR
jgi:threonine synthase